MTSREVRAGLRHQEQGNIWENDTTIQKIPQWETHSMAPMLNPTFLFLTSAERVRQLEWKLWLLKTYVTLSSSETAPWDWSCRIKVIPRGDAPIWFLTEAEHTQSPTILPTCFPPPGASATLTWLCHFFFSIWASDKPYNLFFPSFLLKWKFYRVTALCPFCSNTPLPSICRSDEICFEWVP